MAYTILWSSPSMVSQVRHSLLYFNSSTKEVLHHLVTSYCSHIPRGQYLLWSGVPQSCCGCLFQVLRLVVLSLWWWEAGQGILMLGIPSPSRCPSLCLPCQILPSISSQFVLLMACKEMAAHSSVLAWRIPGMAEPGGLPSLGLHRDGHD